MQEMSIIQKAEAFLDQNKEAKIYKLNTEDARMKYKDQTSLYLQILHSGNKGFICLPRKIKFRTEEDKFYTDKNGVKRKRNPWFNNNFYQLKSGDPLSLIWSNNDSYVTANTFAIEKRTEEHCLGVSEMHLDIDILHDVAPYDKKLADSVMEVVIAQLLDKLPEPTMIVMSGRGLTWIYKYKNLITDAKMIAKHDAAYQNFIEKVQKGYDPEVIEVDSHVVDHARVLRIPGTMNNKAGRNALLLQHNERAVYDPEALYKFLGVSTTVHKADKKEEKKKTKPVILKKEKTQAKSVVRTHSNVMAFCPPEFRRAAKYRMEKMERIPNEVTLVDGSGRHKFLFVYYNQARLINNVETATKMVEALNQRFTEPIEQNDLYRMLNATDRHMEDSEWRVHGDGIYVFSTEEMVGFLPVSKDKAREMGFFDSIERRKQYKENQENCVERDKEIAKLWLSGLGARKIEKEIAGKFLYTSEKTIKRVVKSLGLDAKREIAFEDLDFEKAKRYVRKKYVDGVNSTLNQEGRERENDIFIQLYEKNKVMDAFKKNKDINLLGASGTGKSTLVDEFKRVLNKNMLVVAPTGRAADHIGGKTIHSGFGIPVLDSYKNASPYWCKKLFELSELDTIIIDEIGMVSADLFDYLKEILVVLENRFGSKIQLVTVGDFSQIAPTGDYAFKSKCSHFKKALKLTVKHRQKDEAYADSLDQIAKGNAEGIKYINDCSKLNKGYFDQVETLDMSGVYLSAYKKEVDRVNMMQVRRHRKDASYRLVVSKNGTLPSVPVYVGMPVMFTINEHRFKNGTLGTIVEVCDNYVKVKVDNHIYKIKQMHLKKDSNDQQYPFIPCYAQTIHKSQGSTYDCTVIVDPSCFENGQLYTALSRTRELKQLRLTRKIEKRDMKVSAEVQDYMQMVA